VGTTCDAVKLLISNHLKRHLRLQAWQDFRVKQLWTLEVNDVFEANHEGIYKLFQDYWGYQKQYVSF
jgi:hypothetical protein